MHDPAGQDCIGVDGGGTACRVGLIAGGRRHEVTLGRANVTSDFEGALRTIRAGLEAVAGAAGRTLDDLRPLPAYLGLAGVMDPGIAARVAQALPLDQPEVADDRIAALTGTLAGGDGTLAGIGTGSFLARMSGGETRLIGGYGLPLGDEASGAWLGRALLAHCLREPDGLAGGSDLTRRTRDELGGGAAGIVAFAAGATPEAFGKLAPAIVASAGNGDPVGRELMQAGAAYIGRGLTILGWQPGEALCLAGGVGPHYRDYLDDAAAAAVRPPRGSGLDGALILAARLGRGTGKGGGA